MNCKQGDLAIVVRSRAGNEGKVLTCVRYTGVGILVGDDNHFKQSSWGKDVWEVDTTMKVVTSEGIPDGTCNYVKDSQLRPLRGTLTDNEEEIVKEIYTV